MSKELDALEKCIRQLEEDHKFYSWCQDVRKMKLCLMRDGSVLDAPCVYNNETPLEDEVEITFKDYETAKKYLSKLEALEILRTKIIDVQDVYQYKVFSSFNQRRTLRGLSPISKEEHDLLRETLKS